MPKPKYKRDFPLYNCTSCTRVWQETNRFVNPYSNKNNAINHYADFPTYGLNKKTCIECINKKDEVKVNGRILQGQE